MTTRRAVILAFWRHDVSSLRWVVGRWLPDAKQRLRSAALELIAEQGFAATTVPQITARADLTTRTPTLAARAVSHLRPQSAISFDGRVLGSGPDETPDELRRL